MAVLIYSQSFCQESAERSVPKQDKYHYYHTYRKLSKNLFHFANDLLSERQNVKHKCHCSDTTVKLISSYLRDRSQFVYCDSSKTHSLSIFRSVPQGSILVPLLYIVMFLHFKNVYI